MAHKPAERLDVALMLLDEIADDHAAVLGYLNKQFNLTPMQSKALAALNAASPRMLDRDALYAAVYGSHCDGDHHTVLTAVSKMRKNLPEGLLVTHWGLGYSLSRKIELPGYLDSRKSLYQAIMATRSSQ